MAESQTGGVMFDPGPMPELDWLSECPSCERSCDPYPYRDTPKMVTDRYGWTWPLRSCFECGVTYQAKVMTLDAARAFYASGRYRQLCARVTGKPWDDPQYLREAQRLYACQWSDRMDWAHYGPPFRQLGRWLDYGGSTGVVSGAWCETASSAPPVVTVADYGDGATTTPEQALVVPDGSYDAIICAQTLDHLPAPLQTLRAFLRVAQPGARLFVDVVKRSHTDYKLDHVTYYPTAASFLGLVERSGWAPRWLDAETNPSHYTVLAEKP